MPTVNTDELDADIARVAGITRTLDLRKLRDEVLAQSFPMESFQQGHPGAVSRLYMYTAKKIGKFSSDVVADPSVGNGIAVDTFIKLYKKRKDFASHVDAKAFLYITSRNESMNYLRREQNKEKAGMVPA